MTKKQLVEHLRKPHGRQQSIVPAAELMKWRLEELEETHRDLHAVQSNSRFSVLT